MSALGGILRDRRGAAALEFGLILGVATLLLLGIVQVGAALKQRAEVSYALSRAVRLVYVNPDVTGEALAAALAAELGGRAPTEFDVSVETVLATRVLRVVVAFPYEIALPFVEFGTLTLRVETLTPAIAPAV